MSSNNTIYILTLNDDTRHTFEFDLDNNQLITKDNTEPPAWTRLEYRQCENCTLNNEEHSHCPVALNLHHVVSTFNENTSIDKVELEVKQHDKRTIQRTEMQRALTSMLELLYPISACPHTQWMKPLAHFHTPLANEEQTFVRSISTYLLSEYLKNSQTIQTTGLLRICEEMHTVNIGLANRIRNATQSDAVKNAITLLDMYATLIPLQLEDGLKELRPFFAETQTIQNIEEQRDLTLLPLSEDNIPLLTIMQEEKAQEDETFITKSGLSLALEPIDDEQNHSTSKTTSKHGKAQFFVS